MTRMSRELTLTLLGAGLLTATYFAWPDEDYSKEEAKQAEKRVGGRPRSGGGMFIFIGGYHGGGSSVRGGGSPAMGGSVSKGGFGSSGGRVSGGTGG